MRTGFAWLTLLLLAVVRIDAPLAEPWDSERLYKAEIIVTGTGEKERTRGFREGLKEIFVKLSGDPSLEESGKLDPLLDDSGSIIREYSYEDRMKNLPIRDEQGTRDRPHFLRMTADAGKIETAMQKLGLAIWRDRAAIDVLLTVKDFKHRVLVAAEAVGPAETGTFLGFPIASGRYDGYEQREVLKSIAARRGLTLNLPAASAVLRLQPPVSPPCPGCADQLRFGSAAARYRADLSVLSSGYWRLDARGWGISRDGLYKDEPSCFSFEIAEVSFDTALRKSIDAFAAWLRRDKNAPLCGLNEKI